jgi:hypothetical protein
LCLKRDALLGVVAEFPETQRQMRQTVCRLIMRETVVAYARAVIESVHGSEASSASDSKALLATAGKDGKKDSSKKSPRLAGSVSVIRFMLGEHLEPSLADMAEKHRLHLMARERPEEFAVMEHAVMFVQRVYRGHVARRALHAVLHGAREVTPGTKAMFQVLFSLRLHKHGEEFRALGIERRHLAATTALELCQVTSLPFADAADVILLARRRERDHPMASDRNEVVGLTSPRRETKQKRDEKTDEDGSHLEVFSTPKSVIAKTPGTETTEGFATPAASDVAASAPRDKKQKANSKHQSSKEVFAARAFAKPEDRLGLTVLLAAAKFREGGERRRARRG